MAQLIQNLTYNRMLFLVNACDHLTKAISITSIAAKISKNAAAFVSANGSVIEVGQGWYRLNLTATDTNTLGDMAVHIQDATGKVDDTDFVDQVIALNIANATFPTNFSALSIDSSGRVDNGKWMGSSLASCNVAGVPTMDLARWLGSIPNPLLAGRVDANATVAGPLTVTTNSDKSGYSLTQAFPTNFSALSIDASGRIDAGKWMGTSLASCAIAPGVPFVDIRRWLGSIPNPLLAGRVDANATLANPVILAASQTFDMTGNITGNLSGSVGSVTTVSDKTGYSLAAGQLFIKKNTALAGFMFLMIDSSDHVTPKTGLTITGEVSIDGAAFGALTNAVSEVASGVYKVNLAAADVNGTSLMLKFTATGADARYIPIITQA